MGCAAAALQRSLRRAPQAQGLRPLPVLFLGIPGGASTRGAARCAGYRRGVTLCGVPRTRAEWTDVDTGPGRLELALPADIGASRLARDLTAQAAAQWSLSEELSGDLALVVSELVNNAVEHARSASTLVLTRFDDHVLIEVTDNDGGDPITRHPAPANERGRGLLIVGKLSTGWGCDRSVNGKTVWARLAR
ncbi:ATP-binding protein [Pseudonocardiaceae bacterium YIM PH 21723]|nr:ATP-binding protein [Pseudonocardiaceae bacterium YIM PH 21723]